MTLVQGGWLLLASLVAGALNSVAGGGSFFTFPTLLFLGVAPQAANATNTVGLLPGTLASILPYRDAWRAHWRLALALSIPSLVGGIIGAVILLHTPQATFRALIPYLLLMATALFAIGGRLSVWLRAQASRRIKTLPRWAGIVGAALLQVFIASYGGFFGGGTGILTLALLALLGMSDIHAMNAVKVTLAALINGVAAIAFIAAGVVLWPQALTMMVGAILGGYAGAALARKVDATLVRRFVILVGGALTVYFFLHA